jgi:ABC-type uncharacterized transport system ATPase subunit
MCDRVVLINKGQIVGDAPTAEFAAQPGGLEHAFKSLTGH